MRYIFGSIFLSFFLSELVNNDLHSYESYKLTTIHPISPKRKQAHRRVERARRQRSTRNIPDVAKEMHFLDRQNSFLIDNSINNSYESYQSTHLQKGQTASTLKQFLGHE